MRLRAKADDMWKKGKKFKPARVGKNRDILNRKRRSQAERSAKKKTPK